MHIQKNNLFLLGLIVESFLYSLKITKNFVQSDLDALSFAVMIFGVIVNDNKTARIRSNVPTAC